jgi:hypothetical protein
MGGCYARLVDLYAVAGLGVLLALLVFQTRFFEAHRRAHGLWRPRSVEAPTTLFYTPPEYKAMFRAAFHKDDDPLVERARRAYLFSAAIFALYVLLALPAAVLLGA